LSRVAAPTLKLQLATIRMLFDLLVVGQIMPSNPASVVRGPKHSVKKGKAPVLSAEEARACLDAIDTREPLGLRDRTFGAAGQVGRHIPPRLRRGTCRTSGNSIVLFASILMIQNYSKRWLESRRNRSLGSTKHGRLSAPLS